MESLLKRKLQRGQSNASGSKQYSAFADQHVSHSHPNQTVLRHYALAGCDFGQTVNFTLNTNNLIRNMWLVVDLANADGNYCEDVGLCLIDELRFRYAGQTFHDYDYKNVCFAQMQKVRDAEARSEIKRLCGGIAKASPGKVVVPLYNFWSSYCKAHPAQTGEVWSNGGSAQRLEIEIKFSSKASCSSNSTQAISDAQFYFEEILVSPALESSLKAKGRNPRPRMDYNQIVDVSCSQSVETKIDLSPLVSGGNIRQLLIRTHEGSGATRDPLACARPTRVRIKINGQELFDESEPMLSQKQLLEGYRKVDEHETDFPLCVPFCLNPQGKDSSGYIPHTNDQIDLYLTFEDAKIVDVIGEYERIFERKTGGRINKRDA